MVKILFIVLFFVFFFFVIFVKKKKYIKKDIFWTYKKMKNIDALVILLHVQLNGNLKNALCKQSHLLYVLEKIFYFYSSGIFLCNYKAFVP